MKKVSLNVLENGNWFSRSVIGRLGNDNLLIFWKSKWTGQDPLQSIFSDRFSVVVDPYCKIVDMCCWYGSTWSWNLTLSKGDLNEIDRSEPCEFWYMLPRFSQNKINLMRLCGGDINMGFLWKTFMRDYLFY